MEQRVYVAGDVVDGYVLTERGEWVPRIAVLDSPYQVGDVANGHVLTRDLRWQPLRFRPAAPYRVGDVVEGYLLGPGGTWAPLPASAAPRASTPAGRPPSAAVSTTSPAPGRAPAPSRPASQPRRSPGQNASSGQSSSVGQNASSGQYSSSGQNSGSGQNSTSGRPSAARQATRQAAPQAVRQAQSTQYRPVRQAPPGGPDGRGRQVTSGQGGGPGAQHSAGDVVNGHVLTPDGRWVPLPGTPQAQRRQASSARSGIFGWLVLGFILLQVLRACG